MKIINGSFIAGSVWTMAWFYAVARGWHRNLLCRVGWHAANELHTLVERNNEDNTAFPYSVAEMERCVRCGRMRVWYWYKWEAR